MYQKCSRFNFFRQIVATDAKIQLSFIVFVPSHLIFSLQLCINRYLLIFLEIECDSEMQTTTSHVKISTAEVKRLQGMNHYWIMWLFIRFSLWSEQLCLVQLVQRWQFDVSNSASVCVTLIASEASLRSKFVFLTMAVLLTETSIISVMIISK